MITTTYFDIESGGLEEHHPDIQLAAIAVGPNWEELEVFQAKIQFDESKADPEALKLNSYDPEVWKRDAQPIQEVVSAFGAFLNRHKSLEMVSRRTGAPYSVARLAGHNAATFDGPRLRRLFRSTFLPAHPIPLCTLQRALWYFHERNEKPENYKLEALCKYFGIPHEGAHDALADVRATIGLAHALCSAEVAK